MRHARYLLPSGPSDRGNYRGSLRLAIIGSPSPSTEPLASHLPPTPEPLAAGNPARVSIDFCSPEPPSLTQPGNRTRRGARAQEGVANCRFRAGQRLDEEDRFAQRLLVIMVGFLPVLGDDGIVEDLIRAVFPPAEHENRTPAATDAEVMTGAGSTPAPVMAREGPQVSELLGDLAADLQQPGVPGVDQENPAIGSQLAGSPIGEFWHQLAVPPCPTAGP